MLSCGFLQLLLPMACHVYWHVGLHQDCPTSIPIIGNTLTPHGKSSGNCVLLMTSKSPTGPLSNWESMVPLHWANTTSDPSGTDTQWWRATNYAMEGSMMWKRWPLQSMTNRPTIDTLHCSQQERFRRHLLFILNPQRLFPKTKSSAQKAPLYCGKHYGRLYT